MWGELACHERLLTHRPSSQGWAPGVLPFLYKCFVCLLYVLGWRDGGMQYKLILHFIKIKIIIIMDQGNQEKY